MQDDTIKNILNSPVGPLLAKGFAALYRQKPQFPVRFLANWLLSQAKKTNDQAALAQLQNTTKKEAQQKLKQLEQNRHEASAAAAKAETWEQEKQRFVQAIENEEYVEDRLLEWLPEYLEKHRGLAGCYIGLLTQQTKPIPENNQQENAHIDTEAPKAIRYVGASKSHSQLMLKQVLPADKGVTYQVFKADEEPQDDGNGGEVKQVKPKYLYVPDVLKEQKIHYFRLPKLGSYAAFPLIINSLLNEATFQNNLQEQRKYLQAKQDAEKEREGKLADLKAEIEEVEKKEQEHYKEQQMSREEGTPEKPFEKSQELKELITSYQHLLATPAEYPEASFAVTKKEYVVCCDTLGLDRQIPVSELMKIEELIELFKRKWHNNETKYLLSDINSYNMCPSGQENQESSDHIHDQSEAQYNKQLQALRERYPDQKEASLYADQARLRVYRNHLSSERIEKLLKAYQESYIPKYLPALQLAFFFAGYTKEQVNLQGTNKLEWRKVYKLITTDLAQKVQDYEYFGLKLSVPPYAKVSNLIERMDKLDMEGILNYNLALLTLALRVAERDLLVEKYENKKKDRENKIEEKARIEEEREKGLEAAKAAVDPEQPDSFNQAQWLATFDAEHPIPEIPEEAVLAEYVDI